MLTRRRMLAGTLAAFATPLAAEGQLGDKVHRLGLLDYSSPDAARQAWWDAFRQQMRALGYLEGQNLALERRWGQGDNDRLLKLAVELVGLKLDVLVTAGANAAVAAKRATSTIPIVMATGTDPVELGLAAALRKPGSNITGLTSIQGELAGKRLELIGIVAPSVTRVGVLWDEKNPASRLAVHETEVVARSVGLVIGSIPVRSPAFIDAAFATAVRERVGALSIVPSPMLFTHRQRLAEFAIRHRLPTVVGSREYVEAGGLASFGTDYPDLFRRAATFVDKILKGAKPSDLPVEQPTKFELVINLKTAKALGLTIPPSLLARADEVIQ
jgi:putative tryptophan/tyrosine transport system substrate-binding protein